jgi:hypothetical protein
MASVAKAAGTNAAIEPSRPAPKNEIRTAHANVEPQLKETPNPDEHLAKFPEASLCEAEPE